MTEHSALDVVICGGGLAGLTLALQLRGRLPALRVVVLEPTRRPLPEACFKVGESSVEVGAHYLGHVLGLHDYLLREHLPKNGLRFFCGAPGAPIEERSEMGPREPPRVPAYQLDRGRLENHLRGLCEEAGVDLREGLGARRVELRSAGLHTVTAAATSGDETIELPARWVIDATGRRRLIAKTLGLSRPLEPNASAAWFRVGERIDIAELVDEGAASWRERDVDGARWLSTNHLTGAGYWVWLIPLSSGHTSVGLVAEGELHEFTGFSQPDRLQAWLAAHEPQLAERLRGVPWADFHAMRDYRHGVSRAFSPDRWACVGEAALFVDPLYSPGSDIIALGNTIATELIADDLGPDGAGLNPARVDELDGFFLEWAAMLGRTLVRGTHVFGKAEVLGAKLYWDYFYYWAMLCPYFFREIYRLDAPDHRRFRRLLGEWREANHRAQSVLAAYGEVADLRVPEPFVGLPQPATALSDLHLALLEPGTPDETYDAMRRALDQAEALIDEIVLRALRRAGPERAADVALRLAQAGLRPGVTEARLAADEATAKQRRKQLDKPVRDLERSVGRNAPETAEAPRLRALWKLAEGAFARGQLAPEPASPSPPDGSRDGAG